MYSKHRFPVHETFEIAHFIGDVSHCVVLISSFGENWIKMPTFATNI